MRESFSIVHFLFCLLRYRQIRASYFCRGVIWWISGLIIIGGSILVGEIIGQLLRVVQVVTGEFVFLNWNGLCYARQWVIRYI